jgi:hypothetical protein
MNRFIIPASFLAIALPAGHSYLMTEKGMLVQGYSNSAAAGFAFYGTQPVQPASASPETDDPAWYNNFE